MTTCLWTLAEIYFIRYNPDSYKDKYGKQKNPLFNTRMQEIEENMCMLTRRTNNDLNTELIEIYHTHYDEDVD